VTIDFPEPLLDLERRAWEQIQAGQLTVDAAHAVHQGVAKFVAAAKEAGSPVARYEVEMGLKRIVRNPAEG
jgi:hypothetical protein